MQFFEFSFCHNYRVLARLLFEVISLHPFIVGPCKELLLEVCYGINFVEMSVHLALNLLSTYLALRYPHKPFLAIIPLKQLHSNKLVMAGGAKIHFLQSEFDTVILKHFNIAKLTLRINFAFFENPLHGSNLPDLDFFNELVKFAFAWLYHIFVIFVVFMLYVVIFAVIFSVEAIC